MKDDLLKVKAEVMLVQSHQLTNAQRQTGLVASELDQLVQNSDLLTNDLKTIIALADGLILSTQTMTAQINLASVEQIISEVVSRDVTQEHQGLDLLDAIDCVDMSWDEYVESTKSYAKIHNVDLANPFVRMMSKSQQIEIEKRIEEEFSLKRADCDKYDYMIAGTCGIIAGLADIFLVGSPGQGYLTKLSDEAADGVVKKFAKILGWEEKAGGNSIASAIGFLERKFKINYDHATSSATDGIVKNMSMKNHHLKSLGHSPDLIGLFFSVLDQFTSTAHFVSEGKIVSIDTDSFELRGSNVVSKIFCGVFNWLGHLISDMAGSSGGRGKLDGSRGAGIPIPFYSLLQFLDFGEFGQHRQTFATIAVKVFEKGYDLRHGLALSIPVLISELLTRLMWVFKARFFHRRPWVECVPTANQPELRRMLLVSHGALCAVDIADASLRSGGNIVGFMLRSNLIAWTRFGMLAFKEVAVWYKSGELDVDAVDEYLEAEYSRLLRN